MCKQASLEYWVPMRMSLNLPYVLASMSFDLSQQPRVCHLRVVVFSLARPVSISRSLFLYLCLPLSLSLSLSLSVSLSLSLCPSLSIDLYIYIYMYQVGNTGDGTKLVSYGRTTTFSSTTYFTRNHICADNELIPDIIQPIFWYIDIFMYTYIYIYIYTHAHFG